VKSILVVDDDPLIVVIVRSVLEQEGFQVAVAASGAECLEAVAKQPPDLLVLDIAMPVMNGVETLRVVREQPQTADLPVIVLSARTGERDVAIGQAAGANLYLPKPFTPEELVAATRQLLGAAEEPGRG
jgi:two-component system alkaline phosphatase synthesis response regulator PhoP